MDAYRIAEALNAAHANLDAIKRRHAPAERALADPRQANLRALAGQLLTSGCCLDPMHAASTIADAACCIDTLKLIHNSFTFEPAALQEASKHAERLHDIAEQLAGARVGEIYCKREGLAS